MNSKLTLQTIFAAAIVLAFVAVPVFAQSGDVDVTLRADRQELTVGDPVFITLEIVHPTGYQVVIPKIEQSWGDFEVHSQYQTETVPNDDGTETTTQMFEVTLFAPGEYQTPALPITIEDGNGQVFQETAPPLSMTVNSVLVEGDTQLRDIKPQAELAMPPVWPWILIGSLLAALAAGFGWWMYQRHARRRQLVPALVVDNRPPYQIALDELDHIEELGLPERRRYKEHYSLVADCLRNYLENQHQVRALDRTTTEIRGSLRQTNFAPEIIRHFIGIFTESDLVKFAKFVPEADAAHQIVGRARTLVDQTKPAPQIEASADDSSQAKSEFDSPPNQSGTANPKSAQSGDVRAHHLMESRR